jgi:hypothetical protein
MKNYRNPISVGFAFRKQIFSSSCKWVFAFCMLLLAEGNLLLAQNPGGVTGATLWAKADKGITTSGTTVTAWADQAGTNTFSITGTPVLETGKTNYNPDVLFNGSCYFVGNTGVSATEAFAVAKIQNPSGVGPSGTVLGRFFVGRNDYFFHTEANTFYCSNNNTYVYNTTIGNNVPASVMDVDFSESPASSQKIYLNGKTYTNSGGADPAAIAGFIPVLGARYSTATPEGLLNGSNIAEVILYGASTASSSKRLKIISYLAMKYGITLDQSVSTYLNSAGTTVYAIDATYKNQIIGIARDDASGLLQKQSHTQDDSLRLFVSSLAASNAANGGTISADKASIMIGHDRGKLQNVYGTPRPPSIYSRFGRVWKITNTNFSDTYSLEIKWDSTGTFNIADIRLLVASSPAAMASAAIIAPGVVTYSIGSIIVSGISSSVIPVNSTMYITIGSVSNQTPLPLKLQSFTGIFKNCTAALTWSATEEQSIDHFEVEQSSDGIAFTTIGTTATKRCDAYEFTSQAGDASKQYYRLKVVDRDSKYFYSNIILLAGTCDKRIISVSPNPVRSQLLINGLKAGEQVSIYSTSGQLMEIIKELSSRLYVNMGRFMPGLYQIVLRDAKGNLLRTEKVQKL